MIRSAHYSAIFLTKQCKQAFEQMTSWLLWLKIHAWIGRSVMEWHMPTIIPKPDIPLQTTGKKLRFFAVAELARYTKPILRRE